MKMMKKIIIAALSVLFILASFTPSVTAQTTYITIGTASIGGAFYPIGLGLAKIWNAEIPEVNAVAQATAGSPQNIELMKTGELQVAVVRGQTCYDAYYGEAGYEKIEDPDEYKFLRALTPLYYSGTQIAVLKNSGIESISDFKGKKIAVGPIGSGGHYDSLRLFKLYGLSEDDVQLEYVEASQAVEMMKDGLIDGGLLGLSIGAASIAELMMTGRVKLMSLDEDKLQSYLAEHETSTKFIIEAGTYMNQDYDVTTYAHLPMILGTSVELDEDVAYQLVKEMAENQDLVRESHSIVKQWAPKLAEHDLHIPYHPGAAKYWKEIGIQ